jgi:hypothetical protein
LTLFHVDWDPGGEWILSLSPPHVDRKLIMSCRTLGICRDLGTAPLYKVPSKSTGKNLSRNIFRTERGCVLITQQNLRKFEFFYFAPFEIQIFKNAGW